jgi:hypothetical protein
MRIGRTHVAAIPIATDLPGGAGKGDIALVARAELTDTVAEARAFGASAGSTRTHAGASIAEPVGTTLVGGPLTLGVADLPHFR